MGENFRESVHALTVQCKCNMRLLYSSKKAITLEKQKSKTLIKESDIVNGS